MKIFETDRLIIRKLNENDADNYFDMMGNPNVMNLLPRNAMSRIESNDHLAGFLNPIDNNSDKKVWGIELKTGNELIGICAFIKNNHQEDEIGYHFREQFWNKGFGSEIAKELISFGFNVLKTNKIIADVDVKNDRSVKILAKFMTPREEFFNESDNCTDRRYEVSSLNWIH